MFTGTELISTAAGGPVDAAPNGAIVVGVDGSGPSVNALAWALSEASMLHAPCLVVEAMPAGVMAADTWPSAAGQDAHLTGARAHLHGLVERARPVIAAGDVKVTVDPVLCEPLPALVARSAGAKLLVVGSRGRGPATEALLGSVSEGCMRLSQCPVVVVPPEARVDGTRGQITVGFDGSPSSVGALLWAAREASRRSSRLVIAHVWHVPAVVTNPYVPIASPSWENWQRTGEEVLAEAAASLGPDQPGECRLIEGRAPSTLLALSAQSDLLVVGCRRLGAWAGTVLGSVSQACARKAECPVVVFR